jgi:phosphoglycerol transferase MdoB-like AlkP superfamily enzyme
LKNKINSYRILSWLLLIFIAACLLLPSLGVMKYLQAGSVAKQVLAEASYNQVLVCLAMGLGLAVRSWKPNFNQVLPSWLLGSVTTLMLVLFTAINKPQSFTLQAVLQIIFPVSYGLSAVFSFIIIALLISPLLLELGGRQLPKLNTFLVLLTILSFIATGFVKISSNNLVALELLVPFAWGLLYQPGKLAKHSLLNFLMAVLLFGLNAALTAIIFKAALLVDPMMSLAQTGFLIAYSSPVLLIIAGLLTTSFSKILTQIKLPEVCLLVPASLIGARNFSKWSQYNVQTHSFGISKAHLLLEVVILVALAIIISVVLYKLYRLLPVTKKLEAYLSGQTYHDLANICQKLVADLKHFGKRYHVSLLTWLYFLILSIISIAVVNDGGTINGRSFFLSFLASKHWIPLLTAIFLYALFAILYFICTRYWTALALTSAITLGWSIAEREKLLLRGEPIYVSEIQEITNWKTLLPMVSKSVLVGAGLGLVILVVIVVILELKKPVKFETFKARLIWAVLSVLLFVTPTWFNDQQSPVYYVSLAFDNKATFSNPAYDLQLNGPVLTFLDYANVKVMQKPQNYTDQSLQKIAAKYSKAAKEINKNRTHILSKQTVVFNLSESFVDPKDFPKSKITAGNPLTFINSLQKENTYGHMLSAGYGGGTANMEYESLTGFNMANFNGQVMPYLQVVPKFKHYPNVGQQFNYASAIHPFNGGYYGRKTVYKNFDFNKFAYLGSKYKIIDQKRQGTDWYLSDQTLYANGLHQINARQQGQFINLISIQNHTPYMDWYPNNQYHGHASVDLPFVDGVQKQNYSNYVKGTEYTDKAVKGFIQQIDKINKPIYFVFYGDHYPSIINQSLLKTYPIKLHETTYFIYSNKYARQHGAKAKLNKSSVVTTSDFIAMMLEQSDSKVTPYQALLTKIHEELPAITINYNGGKGMELIDQEGKQVKLSSLNKQQKQLLNDYICVQYDATAGDGQLIQIKGFYR